MGYFYMYVTREHEKSLAELALAERDMPGSSDVQETIAEVQRRTGDIEAAIAFGTAYRVEKAYIERHNKRGTDLDGSAMGQYGALPVPSVYVVDQSGDIVFDFVNADYKVRLPAAELLAAAERASVR